MSTTYQSITICELIALLDKKQIILPRFQRRVVWNSEKRTSFIRSLRKLWPIPAIMLAGRGLASITAENGDELQLIDGLQRMYTITHFTKHLPRYITTEEIKEECPAEFQQLTRTLSENKSFRDSLSDNTQEKGFYSREAENELINILDQWLDECDPEDDSEETEESSSTSKTEQQDKLKWSLLLKLLKEKYDLEEKESDLYDTIERLVEKLRKNFDISSKQLNVIIYSGPHEALPDIFTALNEGGQKLTKFELFASQWATKETVIAGANKEVKEIIAASYEEQLEAGFEILEGEDSNDDPSLHDYLFALSKIICNKYPTLFGDPGRSNELNEIGFNIAATAYGLGIQESNMRELNQRIRYFSSLGGEQAGRYNDNVLIKADLSQFYRALERSCNEALSILRPFLVISFAHSRATESLHNNSQIISIVCRFMNCLFDYTRNFEENPDSTAELEELKKNILSYYLIESLDGTWKGAAANKLWERVWEGAPGSGSAVINSVKPSDFYLNKKPEESLRRELDNYFDRDIESRRQNRKINQSAKVFLKFMMISNGMTVDQLNGNLETGPVKLEIEHLYPVERLNKIGSKLGTKLPINNIGNLAPLPRKINRAKSDLTLTEYLTNKKIKDEDRKAVATALNLLSLEGNTDEERAASIKIPDESNTEELQSFASTLYKEWCKRRFERMKNSIINRIYKA